MSAEADARFPFDQALALARTLWKLGADLGGSYQPARAVAAKVALEGWLGPASQTFTTNSNLSSVEAAQLQGSLQATARLLAYQWVEAHTEQGRVDWSRLVDQSRNSRDAVEKVTDFLHVTADRANYGSPPPPPATPQPPDFAPTAVPKAALPANQSHQNTTDKVVDTVVSLL